MPYLEEFVADRSRSLPMSETFEYDIRPLNGTWYPLLALGLKHAVYHRAGVVFIGSKDEALQYVTQQRARQALGKAEQALRGRNPYFTR